MITPGVTIPALPRRAGRLHPSPLTCESAGEASRVLHRGTLVYVAIGTTRGPLVTPVLYGVTGDRIWFLTNRHALKAKVLRRDPRAAWVVRGRRSRRRHDRRGQALLAVASDRVARRRAAPAGGARIVGGAQSTSGGRVPARLAHRPGPGDATRPGSRLELQPDTVDVVDDPTESAPPAQTAQDRLTSAVPEALRPLLTQRAGVLAVSTDSGLLVAVPVRWTPERNLAHLPYECDVDLSSHRPACLTIDEPVHTRPTEQRGLVLRGHARLLGDSAPVSVHADWITYWEGFTTRTVDIPATK